MKRHACTAVFMMLLSISMAANSAPCVYPTFDESHTEFAYDGCSDLAKYTTVISSNRTTGPISTSNPAWMDLVGISAAVQEGMLEITLYSHTDFPVNVQAMGNATITVFLDLNNDSVGFTIRDELGYCNWNRAGIDRFLLIASNLDTSYNIFPRVGLLRSRFCSDDVRRSIRSVKGVTYVSQGLEYRIAIPMHVLGEVGETVGIRVLLGIGAAVTPSGKASSVYELIPNELPLVVEVH